MNNHPPTPPTRFAGAALYVHHANLQRKRAGDPTTEEEYQESGHNKSGDGNILRSKALHRSKLLINMLGIFVRTDASSSSTRGLLGAGSMMTVGLNKKKNICVALQPKARAAMFIRDLCLQSV